jgi:hypothetical protein
MSIIIGLIIENIPVGSNTYNACVVDVIVVVAAGSNQMLKKH